MDILSTPASDGPLKNVFSYRAKDVLVHAFLSSEVSETKIKQISVGYHNVQKSGLIYRVKKSLNCHFNEITIFLSIQASVLYQLPG